MFDNAENGGNNDGFIDAQDEIYNQLLLWTDDNHDGVSQASEVKHLRDLKVYRIDLQYERSRRVDEFGNSFYYRARIWDADGKLSGRAAWDVFLKMAPE